MITALAQLRAETLSARIAGLDRFIAGLEFAACRRDALANRAHASDRHGTAAGNPLRISVAEKHQRSAAADLRRRAAMAEADREALVRERDQLLGARAA